MAARAPKSPESRARSGPEAEARVAAAKAANADVLVTGDRTHFGHLYGKITDGVRVLTLRESLEAILNDA